MTTRSQVNKIFYSKYINSESQETKQELLKLLLLLPLTAAFDTAGISRNNPVGSSFAFKVKGLNRLQLDRVFLYTKATIVTPAFSKNASQCNLETIVALLLAKHVLTIKAENNRVSKVGIFR